jgi:DNA-binding beta-propeller fold protein YncE
MALVMSWALGSLPQNSGSARLIAFQPIVEPTSCEWMPEDQAPASLAAMTSFQAAQRSTLAAQASGAGARDEVAARQPVRFIHDPNASFSNVVVDPKRDEVVLLDANRFEILVYNRLDNTAPSQPRTEPKRRIGGQKTLSQFASDIYVDPVNSDIYAVNNDSLRGMNVFSTRANGDVPPDRHFEAPYGSFGINVDEQMQELFVTIQHDSAIGVWPKTAEGQATPIRSIQGGRTRLADPHGIAFDLKNRLMYVANFGTSRLATAGREPRPGVMRIPNWPAGNQMYREEVVPGTGKFGPPSITVYPMRSFGDVSPLRLIQGPKTLLSWPTGISVDSERGELYVANDTGDSVTVYGPTANGDVAPIRVLKGPKTLIKNPLGVHVDVVHDEVWVANYGNHSATVYRRTATGDVPPLRVIRSAPATATATMISNPFEITFDAKRQEILVPS